MSKGRRLDDKGFSATLLERALRLLDEALKKGEVKKAGEVKGLLGIKYSSMIYNYSLRTLIDNKIEGQELSKEGKEPLIDLFDDEDNLTLIFDLPGFKEEEINLKLMENKLIILINDSDYEEISLPTKVKADKIDKLYRNGILEVRLKKM